MVRLQMQGGLGNNLFQYAFARLLAEQLGYALEVELASFDGHASTGQFKRLLALFSDAPIRITGKAFDEPVDRTVFQEAGGFDGYMVDWDALAGNGQDRLLLVRGFFERYGLFRPHKDKLRRWFAVPPDTLGYDIHPDDIVVHIRRGDFWKTGRAIDLSFYTDLLRRMQPRKLYVCGVGIDDKVRNRLRTYAPIYIEGAPVSDFLFMKGFKRIVQSQSTFAWWAGFLSDATEIHTPVPLAPLSKFGRRYPNIDLRVDDEPRYRYTTRVKPDLEQVHLIDMREAHRDLTKAERLRLWPLVALNDGILWSRRVGGSALSRVGCYPCRKS